MALPNNLYNDFNDYQARAKSTAVYKAEHSLEYLTLGLVGEAGEIANKVKKFLRGDHDDKGAIVYKEKLEEVVDELGDVLWYLSELARTLNTDLADVASNNLDKLARRSKRNSVHGEGDNR